MANCREYYDETSRLLKHMHDGTLAGDDAKRLHKLLGQWEDVDCPNNGADCVHGKCPYAETPDWITTHGYTDLQAMVLELGYMQEEGGRKFDRIPQKGSADPAELAKGKRMWAGEHGERVYRKSRLSGLLYIAGGVVFLGMAYLNGLRFFVPKEEWLEIILLLVAFLGAGILFVIGGLDPYFDRKPVLVIGDRGVLTREFGLIPWNEIASARGFSAKGTRIFIMLRDPGQYARKQGREILTTELEIEFNMMMYGSVNDAAALISARAAGPAAISAQKS